MQVARVATPVLRPITGGVPRNLPARELEENGVLATMPAIHPPTVAQVAEARAIIIRAARARPAAVNGVQTPISAPRLITSVGAALSVLNPILPGASLRLHAQGLDCFGAAVGVLPPNRRAGGAAGTAETTCAIQVKPLLRALETAGEAAVALQPIFTLARKPSVPSMGASGA